MKKLKYMQIIKSKSNIVEKVFRDKEGRLVRATFCVYENAGRIKARLLDFTYIESIKGSVTNFYISFKKTLKSVFESSVSKLGIFELSNYRLGTIYSIGSKPRAPTLI